MLRFLALLLEQPLPAPASVTLLRLLVAGLLAGVGWGAVTRRLGFTSREQFASALVPAVATRMVLSRCVLWPFGGDYDAHAPPSTHELWRFSAAGGVVIACGAGLGVFLAGLRGPHVGTREVTTRDYCWLLTGIFAGWAFESFAVYEGFLQSYGLLHYYELNRIGQPCNAGVLPHGGWPSLGEFQLQLIRQALWPSPPNPFVLPTGVVPLSDSQARLLQVFGGIVKVELVLTLLLVVTHMKKGWATWQHSLARLLGGAIVITLVVATTVIARSRSAALGDMVGTLLPSSDFRWLALIAAASVTATGCLAAFVVAPWDKGPRLACAFGMLSALAVLRVALDQAVLPDFQYAELNIDIQGARFGVERYLLGGCALLLSVGLFPWRDKRAFLSLQTIGADGAFGVLAGLVLLVLSVPFAHDEGIRFTWFDTVDRRYSQVAHCQAEFPRGAPVWTAPINAPGSTDPDVESDPAAYSALLDRLDAGLRRLEEAQSLNFRADRDRVLGAVVRLDAPAQDLRCVLVAASARRAAVVVLAQRVEQVQTATLGRVPRGVEECGAGRIGLSVDDPRALPIDSRWSVRELLDHARDRVFNPRLDPDTLPPGCH